MWAAILPYLVKFGISLAISLLEKTGVISHAEGEITQDGVAVLHAVGQIKTYSSPDDFPTNIRNGGKAPN